MHIKNNILYFSKDNNKIKKHYLKPWISKIILIIIILINIKTT